MEIDFSKVIYYDSEYCFPGTSQQKQWRWAPAKLRIQTIKIGYQQPKIVDVWKEPDLWAEIFDLLEKGYILVAHNAIADIRPDLCPDRILKYVLNGQVHDTLYLERLIHGMTDPIGEWHLRSSYDEDEDSDDEEEDSPFKNKQKPFALDKVVFRHTGVVLKKTYQSAWNWLKQDLSDKALEYAANDIKYLPTIYKNQIEAVNKLGLWKSVNLNHYLLGTSFLTMKYGVPINVRKLVEHRNGYREKARDLERKLLEILPKVSYTDSQLIEMYFKTYWRKGGLLGLTNKTKAMKLVKEHQNHALTTSVWNWVYANRDKVLRSVNLRSAQQKLEAFRKLGYDIDDTAESTIKEYMSENDCPVLESYLSWQKCNSLLNKYLETMDYNGYLRKDNTIKTTFTWVNALNGRSSASDMNVQQLPRELKDLYGHPPGMVKVEYDYSAIELMKMLNDFPVMDQIQLILDDKEDIHIYNAAKFFHKDYRELLEQYRSGCPEAKKLRNAAKTIIYFLIYKTPVKPGERFVTGTARLIQTFNDQLAWTLTKEEAEHLILTGESILSPWTNEKLAIDSDVCRLANERNDMQSQLLRPLRDNPKDMETAIEEGIIYFRGALEMYYQFDLLRDRIYTPEKEEYNNDTGEFKTKKEYVNSRSLYSCRLAGPIAMAAKSAVEAIQRELVTKYGHDRARLGLFVHDSITCYCIPEIQYEVEQILCKNMLKVMYDVAEFSILPVYIEGGINGEERKIGYNGSEFQGLKLEVEEIEEYDTV